MKLQKKKFSPAGGNKKPNRFKSLSPIKKKKGKSSFKKKNKETAISNGISKNKSKKNLEDMDFDEFVENDLDQMSDVSGEDEDVLENYENESQTEEAEISPKKKKAKRVSEAAELKANLKELEDTDPDFYKFLQKEDKDALDFDVPDSEEEEDSEADDESSGKSVTINSQLLKQWSEQMKTKDCRQCLPRVVSAFHAAVAQAEGSEEKARTYIVRGNEAFNMVVRFCLVEMIPASAKFLKASDAEKNLKPPRHKRWKKLRVHMKTYLTDMTKLLDTMSDSSLKLVLLKHVHQLMPYYCSLPKVAKMLLKHLVTLWGSGEPPVQVLAFVCILRIIREHQNTMLDPVLRGMYMMYVKSVKFTSARTWPGINLMRRSLVELYGLDHTVAYRQAFLYIRQLAIHLRNAITDKKKDVIRTVYNWQFIHSLHFWCQLLSTLYPSDDLQPLIYPLTQVIIGTIGVVPVAKYYPLRFQCCRMLIKLTSQTKTFIPVLPFLLDVLNFTDFNKKHSKSSVRPLDFNCMLRLSAAQLTESGFRDGLIEQVYELILTYLSSQANSIGFPELVLPATLQMKNFMKTCKVGNFTRKIKQLLTKIEENSKWLETKRKRVNFSMSQFDKVAQWENMMQVEGPPICKFFENWKEVAAKKRELLKDEEEEEIPKELDVPKVRKKEVKQKKSKVVEEQDEGASEEESSPVISSSKEGLGEDKVETLRLEDLSESEESGDDDESNKDEETGESEEDEGSDDELSSE